MPEFRADPKAKRLLPLQIAAPDIEAWLLDRDPMAIGSYREIGREEYARAFTAAQTAGYDVIDDLYFGIIDTIARNGTEDDFAKLVTPVLRAKGWLGGDDGAIAIRVRLIYDTNLRLARRAGRWDNYWNARASHPYLRAFTVGDERVRHPPHSKADHRAWDGIILPITHPFWQEYGTGSFAWRCRCQTVQMTRSELARRKDGITSEEDLADRKRRIGPPRFAGPGLSMQAQLADMVAATNDGERMPGMPRVDPVATAKQGGDEFDAVLRAASLKDIGRQLTQLGF